MLFTALLAVVVTAGVIVAVVLLRPAAPTPSSDPGVPPVSDGAPPAPGVNCGDSACREISAMTVGGLPVVLLADDAGKQGVVRIGADTVYPLIVNDMGVTLKGDSLRCVDGATPVCLVRGEAGGGSVGELFVARGGIWRDTGKPYFSDAGTVALNDVTADGIADVIVVRHECPGAQSGSARCQAAPVLAEVYDVARGSVGCTRRYTAPSELRGWPDVRLTKADLRACP
ncbi:hypothetical protein [Amycolatopsis decaplanina]|uniref:FG-GAP repeat-containing protein n=1 Tax=Amycolatopsis decaplanina DSM 44594 TaxID=1284240 RepID=M2X924_9PSEU|nr:hypothetical protein [Amycolatopsis decaplanina]EME57601.1 hypothetical protein H074_20462 [Amycolatopsis decaplanina DSM 44594]